MPQSYSHPARLPADVLRRRKWWFTIPCPAVHRRGIAAAHALAAHVSDRARPIAVQAPTVTPDLVARGPRSIREERLRALTQQLRSPSVLERVAREEAARRRAARRQPSSRARGNINIEPPKPITRTRGCRRS